MKQRVYIDFLKVISDYHAHNQIYEQLPYWLRLIVVMDVDVAVCLNQFGPKKSFLLVFKFRVGIYGLSFRG